MRNPIMRLADRRHASQHPGLLLQRYLAKDATGDGGDPAERRALLGAAIAAARSASLHAIYRPAFARWNESFPNDGLSPCVDLRTLGRIIVGLGSENVLETGIRLHHTYGLPMIPGSALKGLTSHYCDHACGQRGREEPPDDNRLFRRGEKYHDLLFGTTDDGGVIAFHDAWIVPDSLSDGGLMLDVMTPHHPQWQMNVAPPTDFDSPNPVAFLSVCGVFRIRVSWVGPPDHEQARSWTDLAFQLLKEALAEWGVGGKTSSGYGRLIGVDAVAPASSLNPATQASKAPPRPRHQRYDKVTVTRVEDSAKGRRRFQADDGFVGNMDAGDGPPIDVGKTAELWIANVSPQSYTFTMTEPKVKARQQPSQYKKGRR